jgi:putative ATP-dependent endonuclease of OLD family
MYLHRIKAENFRVFGTEADGKHLDLGFSPSLNVLVGENDAGKSSIIDAIRFVLLTTSYEYLRFQDGDFHIKGSDRAATLSIEVQLKGLSVSQQAAVAEWLTYTPGEDPYLVVCVKSKRAQLASGKQVRAETRYYSGVGGTGIEIGAAVRDLVRATYLKPLRDAEAELRPGRNSRLSQVLRAHKDIQKEAQNDFDPKSPHIMPKTLVGHMARAQYDIQKSPVIDSVQDELNTNHLAHMGLAGSELSGAIKVASEVSLSKVLEQLELSLIAPNGVSTDLDCGRGLGYNNVLFMATELLLLERQDELALLLIEEPEAHLHPQLQARVLQLLERRADSRDDQVQVIMSTHSPNIASSASVEDLILVCKGKAFRLASGETMLEKGDYSFLRRFLDVTKANLFFARAVAMVEGQAEMLLLPALAEACGRSFREAGVSMVNVGTVGLFRYARVLQRADKTVLPIRVACLTDRDIVPDHVSYVEDKLDKDGNIIPRKFQDYSPEAIGGVIDKKEKRAQGGSTQVFVSDEWTLEYDLASGGTARLMRNAVMLATKATSKDGVLTDEERQIALDRAAEKWDEHKKKDAGELAALIYKPLYSGSVSKVLTAQFAAELLATGDYGQGDELLKQLPAYLRNALLYLVPKDGDDLMWGV